VVSGATMQREVLYLRGLTGSRGAWGRVCLGVQSIINCGRAQRGVIGIMFSHRDNVIYQTCPRSYDVFSDHLASASSIQRVRFPLGTAAGRREPCIIGARIGKIPWIGANAVVTQGYPDIPWLLVFLP